MKNNDLDINKKGTVQNHALYIQKKTFQLLPLSFHLINNDNIPV
jgi:hypothetical protein